MSKSPIKWLSVLIIAMICATGWAVQPNEGPTEKFIGKWDSHAGIISFFLQNTAGKKQLRMLAADESANAKIAFNLLVAEVDDFEELVEIAIYEARKLESSPIPPLSAKEITKQIGSLIYTDGKIKLFVVEPAGTQGYVLLRIAAINNKTEIVFWMDKEDLVSLKKLLDRALKEVGES